MPKIKDETEIKFCQACAKYQINEDWEWEIIGGQPICGPCRDKLRM